MRARATAGFTYVGLIILVAVIGLVGAASLKVNALLERAEAEEELLDIGAAFADALQSYASATPRGQPQQPPSLKELLLDPRFPNPRRHLRKVFVDPVTGKAEWGLMYAGDKAGIIGVYSLSQAKPFKIANFNPRFQNFEAREHLSDWRFTVNGQGAVLPAAAQVPLGEAAKVEAAAKAEAASLFARQQDTPEPVKPAPKPDAEAAPAPESAKPAESGEPAEKAEPKPADEKKED